MYNNQFINGNQGNYTSIRQAQENNGIETGMEFLR